MSEKIPMGIDPKIKKEINEEGFEGDAAVLIGKNEEMSQLLEKLEKEGRAENLGSYIKMHKEIALPLSEADDELKEKLLKNIGSFTLYSGEPKEDITEELHYIDIDGNVARVDIAVKNVASLRDTKEQIKEKYGFGNSEKLEVVAYHMYNATVEKLGEIGFSYWLNEKDQAIKTSLSQMWLIKIKGAIKAYEKKLEKERGEKKKEEFDF